MVHTHSHGLVRQMLARNGGRLRSATNRSRRLFGGGGSW
jgi:hypothetical protein